MAREKLQITQLYFQRHIGKAQRVNRMSARQRTERGRKKKRREPAARVFSIIIRQSICVRMDCALRGGRERKGDKRGEREGVERESVRERVAGGL